MKHSTRRHFLQTALAGLMATQFPVRQALASSASDRKFLFVFATGGWDVTKVFATEFANPNIDFEPSAQLGVVGNLSFVDHGARSATRRFFERFYEKTLIVNGVQVPSVAHDSCRRLMMTGTTNDGSSDWPALLAAKRAETYPLPHLVLDGPAYPGQFGQVVTRTGTSGQLDALLNGSILEWSDTPVGASDYRAEEIVDRYLRQRTSAELVGAEAQRKSMLEGFEVSLSRAGQLKAYQHDLNWEGGGFSEQTALAIDALERGLTRCITLDYSEDSWDTHSKGEPVQSSNFQGLFLALESMLDALAVTPGSSGPLSEETVVVVLSEMGRTPQLNAKDGRDHWPYTSALLIGPGITGNRVVGGFNDYFYGETLDLATGEIHEDGAVLTSAALGGALLALGDVDPVEFLPEYTPALGLLSS